MGSYYYLASPYSHPDPAVEDARFAEAGRFVAWAFRRGIHVFSPIVHCHPLARAHGLAGDAAAWAAFDRAMISSARGVLLLAIDGWRQSVGVSVEIFQARSTGKPVGWARPAGDGYAVGSWERRFGLRFHAEPVVTRAVRSFGLPKVGRFA